MALHDPSDDLHHQAELDRLTREKAGLIMTALAADSKLNTEAMIKDLGDALGSDKALGLLIQRTARGENAFLELVKEHALDAAEKAARDELAAGARRRKESQDEQRVECAVDAREAAA